MNELTKADLIQVGDDEPRMLDLRVAERLGFAQTRDIRKLISRNRDELESYGALRQGGAKPTGGRPATEYLLNEGQILVISMKSDAPNAVVVRREVITVYQAWRRGELGVAIGITRSDLLAMEARFEARLSSMENRISFVAEAYDPTRQKVVTHRPTVFFLTDQKVSQKGRRGLTVKVSKQLLQLAVSIGDLTLLRMENENTGRWLFHVDLFNRWLADGGAETIRAHKDVKAGQGVMKFTVVPKTPPANV